MNISIKKSRDADKSKIIWLPMEEDKLIEGNTVLRQLLMVSYIEMPMSQNKSLMVNTS